MTTIETYGGVIRPLLEPFKAAVEEAKLRTTPSGIKTRVTDPANVLALDYHVPGDGLDTYNFNREGPWGVQFSELRSILSFARKGRGNNNGDRVTMSFMDSNGSGKLRAEISREDGPYRATTLHFVDPDSIRPAPDIPDVEDLDRMSTQVNIGVDALRDAVDAADDHADSLSFYAFDGDLVLETFHSGSSDDDDQPDDEFVFEDAAAPLDDDVELGDTHEEPDGSLVSLDYLTDVTKAASSAGMDHLALWYGDEVPVYLKYHDTDTGATAMYSVAPRITSD